MRTSILKDKWTRALRRERAEKEKAEEEKAHPKHKASASVSSGFGEVNPPCLSVSVSRGIVLACPMCLFVAASFVHIPQQRTSRVPSTNSYATGTQICDLCAQFGRLSHHVCFASLGGHLSKHTLLLHLVSPPPRPPLLPLTTLTVGRAVCHSPHPRGVTVLSPWLKARASWLRVRLHWLMHVLQRNPRSQPKLRQKQKPRQKLKLRQQLRPRQQLRQPRPRRQPRPSQWQM